MKTIKVDIGKEYSKKIAMGPIAILLFNSLQSYDKAILDFKNLEFTSRSFAQEYVYQKHHSKVEIVEINKSDFIKGLFDVVEEDYRKTFLS